MEIIKNAEFPAPTRPFGARSSNPYPLDEMSVGDAFVIPGTLSPKDKGTVRARLLAYRKRPGNERKCFHTQDLPAGWGGDGTEAGFGIQRVEDRTEEELRQMEAAREARAAARIA